MARMTWTDVPEHVRELIADRLGSPVIGAASQASGFSPGSADRLLLADGRRVFVKAISAAVNPDSIHIDRREARVLRLLPTGLPLARLIDVVDTGDWVALILEDVDGHHPTWADGQVETVLDAVGQVSRATVPAGEFTPLTDSLADDFAGWLNLSADDALPYDADTNVWVAHHLDMLTEQAAEGLRRCSGTVLVHGDLRADNVLLRKDDGQPVLLDWPWAQVGSAWFDPVSLLVNVLLLRPGFDIDETLATHPVFAGMPDGTAECLFAGLASYFTFNAIQPPPPGISGLRSFQRDQGAVILAWLRHRLED